MFYFFVVILIALLYVILLTVINREMEDQILTVLLRYGEMYGLQILDAIEHDFGRKVSFGSLYPTLHRLEREGFVTSRWEEETIEALAERGGARRKYYRRVGSKKKSKRHKYSLSLTRWRFTYERGT